MKRLTLVMIVFLSAGVVCAENYKGGIAFTIGRGSDHTMPATIYDDVDIFYTDERDDGATYYDFSDVDQTNDATQADAAKRPGWTSEAGGLLDFDGGNDFISIPTSQSLGASGTVMGWFRKDDDVTGYAWTFAGTANKPLIRLYYNSGRNAWNSTGSDAAGAAQWSWAVGSAPVTLGVWYHVAITWESNNAKLYSNGIQKYSDASVTMPVWTPLTSQRGALNGGTFFDGQESTWELVSRSLSSNEVFAEYMDEKLVAAGGKR